MKTIRNIHIALMRHDPPKVVGVRAPADSRPVPGRPEAAKETGSSSQRH